MTLFLLPNVLGPTQDHSLFFPSSVDHVLEKIDGLIAESEGEGRRYLKRFATKKKPHLIPIALLTKHTSEFDFLLEPVLQGESWGVVSDCGLPCLADPGAALVKRARELNLPIQTFVGPSSITHALMLSGLSAQSFTFHGYLPKNPQERIRVLKEWERVKHMTHLFIEAPYRNMHTFQACLETLHDKTLFCVASQLTTQNEWVETHTIRQWHGVDIKKISNHIAKQPTIYLFRS